MDPVTINLKVPYLREERRGNIWDKLYSVALSLKKRKRTPLPFLASLSKDLRVKA